MPKYPRNTKTLQKCQNTKNKPRNTKILKKCQNQKAVNPQAKHSKNAD